MLVFYTNCPPTTSVQVGTRVLTSPLKFSVRDTLRVVRRGGRMRCGCAPLSTPVGLFHKSLPIVEDRFGNHPLPDAALPPPIRRTAVDAERIAVAEELAGLAVVFPGMLGVRVRLNSAEFPYDIYRIFSLQHPDRAVWNRGV